MLLYFFWDTKHIVSIPAILRIPCIRRPNLFDPALFHRTRMIGSGWLIRSLHSRVFPDASSCTAKASCSGSFFSRLCCRVSLICRCAVATKRFAGAMRICWNWFGGGPFWCFLTSFYVRFSVSLSSYPIL